MENGSTAVAGSANPEQSRGCYRWACFQLSPHYVSFYAPVAQLDRALVSGTRGRRFNSSQARHFYSFIFKQFADFTR